LDEHAQRWQLVGSKAFFSEEKNQKTFIRCRAPLRSGTRQRMKVFWFFFSKKNRWLPALVTHRNIQV
jgi:hypothetical protein